MMPARARRAAAAAWIAEPEGPPTIDDRGRVRSVQAAEIPSAGLTGPGSRAGLERLGAAYWRFLTRITLGLIRVRPAGDGRTQIVLAGRPLVLFAFAAPTFDLQTGGGSITWPITGGLLLGRAGRDDPGVLRIGVMHVDRNHVRVEVAVFGFVPSIARLLGPRVYSTTQSRIHVMLTHAFLRSLSR